MLRNATIIFLVIAAGIARRVMFAPTVQALAPASAGVSRSQTAGENFPSEIPLIPGASDQRLSRSGSRYTAEMTSNEPVLSAVHYYQNELATRGWEVDQDAGNGDVETVSAIKTGHEIEVLVRSMGDTKCRVRVVYR